MSLEAIVARLRAGDPRAALALIEAQHARSTDPNVLYLTGTCRYELRDFAGALEMFDRALESAPRNPHWLHASALACEDLGKPEEALARYQRAIDAAPDHADALHNHGLLLAKLGRREEALESHRDFVKAHPGSARAHADLADILLSLDRCQEALDAAARAVKLEPRAVEAALTAGLAAAMLERFDESARWFEHSKAGDPEKFDRLVARQLRAGLDRDLDPRSIRLIRGFDRLQSCDWSDHEHYVAVFAAAIEWWTRNEAALPSPPLVFRSLAAPLSPEARRTLADSVARRLGSGGLPTTRARDTRGRIRVGYVSPDFGTHPTGILSSPLFALHDRSKFEVHAFSLGPDDGSDWRRRVRENADQFHDLHGASPADAEQRVRAARIDVLVDLAGITTGALPELFARRSAPVQVSYLGFPGTSGEGFVDFLVGDPVCIPAEEEHAYAETVVRLPDTFWLCDPGEAPAPPSRHEAGLPEDAFVFYAHHPGQKITPAIFSAWMEILRSVPYAVLWLLADRPDTADNLRREAAERGIGPHRLVFAGRVPYDAYRRRIALADLGLDTPIYNGGATTLDALACGLPVLSCPGRGFAGRMAASALCAADLRDLVVPDLEAYRARAVAIARDRDAHAALRQRVARARGSSRLFDVAGRVRQLEAAYFGMRER